MKLQTLSSRAVAVLLTAVSCAQAEEPGLSVGSENDIKQSARVISQNLLSYYHGNETGETPGLLSAPPPDGDYYWYVSGAMWSILIDYWHYTADESYNDLITRGLLWQVGDRSDFLPANVTAQAGNDDQATWALAAMAAAEYGFPSPPKGTPQWADLAKTVFEELASRWDKRSCGGGLRWQILSFNSGDNYKNSISTGMLFNLGARLARYTGNQTYADWADKSWNWMEDVGLLDKKTYGVYDGADVQNGCEDINSIEWSRDNAIFVLGSAAMYNTTNGDDKWKTRLDRLVAHGTERFFKDKVAYEPSCESINTCTSDIQLFKGLFHQWYSAAIVMAPYLRGRILPLLQNSAAEAVKQCTGGKSGRECGYNWASGEFKGKVSAMTEMDVLSAVSGLLVENASGLKVEKATDGSKGDKDEQGSKDGEDKQGGASGNSTSQNENEDSAGTRISVLVQAVATVGLLIAIQML